VLELDKELWEFNKELWEFKFKAAFVTVTKRAICGAGLSPSSKQDAIGLTCLEEGDSPAPQIASILARL
jgi:hypothetical protein